MGEDQADNNAGRAVERVTISEAAELLGCHPNTVRSRVKAGMYRAEKVHTENGPTWMIERDSLTNNAPTSASQQAVSGVPAAQQEAIQELARAIVREAGLVRHPEQEARRENDKAYAEFLRNLALVDTALLAGIVATVAFIGQLVPDSRDLLRASVAANVLGIVCAVGALMVATIVVAADAYEPSETVTKGRRWRDRLSLAAFVWFGVSALAFMLVVANNLNVLGG